MSNESFWWDKTTELKHAMRTGQVVKALVTRIQREKVGVIQGEDAAVDQYHETAVLDLGGVKGYCPQEEFDTHNFRSLRGFVGHTIDVCILDVNEEDQSLYVSRKLAQAKLGKKTWETIEIGQVMEGTISGWHEKDEKRIVFINLGGVEAFCYLEDWDHVRVPSVRDVGVAGEPVTVKVKTLIKEEGIVRVSRKDAIDDPWKDVTKEFPINQEVLGVVVNVDPEKGIFVRLKKGVTIRGIIPRRSNLTPPVPGQPVAGPLVALDEEKRRGRIIITRYPHGSKNRHEAIGSYLFE